MKIKVTSEMMRLARRPKNCAITHCVIARALLTAGFKNVQVGLSTVITSGHEAIDLPVKVSNFIWGFYNNLVDVHRGKKLKTYKPFSFTLTKQQVAQLRGSS